VLSKCFECAKDHLAEGEIGEVVEDFVDLFYEPHLRREWTDAEADDRLDDLKELAGQIAGNPGGLEAFLADVALLTNLDASRNDPEGDRLTLSTVHQAKGMEFDYVFIAGLHENGFPSYRAVKDGNRAEEQRLFYTAVTRARKQLFLSWCQYVKNHKEQMESTFIASIPKNCIAYCL
jgi:DNA helicase-2/ATP-dependent DNA helicase PcrA